MASLRNAFACSLGFATCVLCGCATEPPFRDGSTWCGDPEAVQSADNPYVRLAERNVTRALSHPDVFWLVWGCAAPESSRKGDAALRTKALDEMEKLTARLAEKPSAYWDILVALECVRLLGRLPDLPEGTAARWLAQLRPSVEANVRVNDEDKEWMCVAPNTLHQSAAILQLASVLYKEPTWSVKAAALVLKAGACQQSDGAFTYMRESGPSQIYYGFDATFLGRYYQFSRDPVAREQLIRMSNYSLDVLGNGLMESSSSPWWKHHWGTGGPIHGVEIAAGLSRDPLARAVAEFRLRGGQPFSSSYIPMYFWDPSIGTTPLAPDTLRYDTNIGGPQLRRGAWQVVMPCKAYDDTGIGCTVVKGDKPFAFDGYLETAALPILRDGTGDAYATTTLLVAAQEDTTTRAAIVGDEWIAGAWTYQPRHPFYGNPTPPPPTGWRVTCLWFADAQGLAGWILATCEQDSKTPERPKGYVSLGHAPIIEQDQQQVLTSGALQFHLWGENARWEAAAQPRKAEGMGPSKESAWISLPGGDLRSHRAGESFGYGLSAATTAGATTEARLARSTPMVEVELTRKGTPLARLIFNPTAKGQKLETPVPTTFELWRSNGAAGDTPSREMPTTTTRELNAYQLGVILPAQK